ncbi:hypothetical protein [Streptomyces sp. SP18BB07]|uniref:hypothetical protein n=1 Tax=Streptomyces sp. SP18BB07 TaxID=3002522 RepID=UPI002E763416|nr:hypothetical protein [Streptomyces sp. SP18BB07]MEE1757885.1 hypothetical protein [Streptomyces sp. SP18BB07]
MVDVALAAVDVTATVFVMNDGGHFHRRHLLAEARRHLALVLRSRRRDPGLDDQIVATAISTHCLDTSEPKTARGLLSDYRLYTARWALSDLPARRSPPTPAPDRHLLETLRGQEFTRGLDDYIANRALSDRSRQSTVPHPGRRLPTSSSTPPTSPSSVAGGSPAPTASLPASQAGTSGLELPASPCRTRSAQPVPRPPPHRTTLRLPRTRKTTTIRRQTCRTPLTIRAGMPCSPWRSGPPLRPISRLRWPRSTWRAVRPTRRRGCAHLRIWNGSAAFTCAANARRRAFETRPKPEQSADVVKSDDQQQHHANRPEHSRGVGRDR